MKVFVKVIRREKKMTNYNIKCDMDNFDIGHWLILAAMGKTVEEYNETLSQMTKK